MKPPADKRMSFTMDRLIDQIIEGRKTTSADWLHEQGELDEWDSALVVGDYYTVCDSNRIPRSIIRITMMAVCRWSDIPEWLWRGETNKCAQEFRDDHIDYFKDPSDDFEFVGYQFHLVEAINNNQPQPSES